MTTFILFRLPTLNCFKGRRVLETSRQIRTISSKFKPVKLSYKQFEANEGSNPNIYPIIFLHGAGRTKKIWQDIPQTVAERLKAKAFAYDARNYGDSEYSNEFSFDLNVHDLFNFMDTMNIPKAIVVGHSMGGITATHAALRKPDRFEMVFSVDMFIKPLTQFMLDEVITIYQLLKDSVKSIPKGLNLNEAQMFINDYVFKKFPDSSIKQEDLKNPPLKRTPEEKYELDFNVDIIMKSWGNAETLTITPSGLYQGPAFFLYGTESFIGVNNEEEHIKKHFPKAKLLPFEGGSHQFHLDEKEKFIDTIIKCIDV